MKKYYVHEEMLLTDEKVFKTSEEQSYRVTCYDGFAIGVRNDGCNDEDCPRVVFLTYPKLKQLTREEKQDCLAYRGIRIGKCNYEDVCMNYGVVTTKPSLEFFVGIMANELAH